MVRSDIRQPGFRGRFDYCSVRTFDQGFRRACEAHGLRVSESERREVDEQREVLVRLTEVCWP